MSQMSQVSQMQQVTQVSRVSPVPPVVSVPPIATVTTGGTMSSGSSSRSTMDPEQLSMIPESELNVNNEALFAELPPMLRDNPGARQRHLEKIRGIRAEYARTHTIQEDIRAREEATRRLIAERRARIEKVSGEISMLSAEFLQAKEDTLDSIDELLQGYAYGDSSVIAALLYSIRTTQIEALKDVDERLKKAIAEGQMVGLFDEENAYDPKFFEVAYNDISTKFQEVVGSILNINDPQLVSVLEDINDDLTSMGATIAFKVEVEERDPLIGRARQLINEGNSPDQVMEILSDEGYEEDKVNIAVTEAMFGNFGF